MISTKAPRIETDLPSELCISPLPFFQAVEPMTYSIFLAQLPLLYTRHQLALMAFFIGLFIVLVYVSRLVDSHDIFLENNKVIFRHPRLPIAKKSLDYADLSKTKLSLDAAKNLSIDTPGHSIRLNRRFYRNADLKKLISFFQQHGAPEQLSAAALGQERPASTTPFIFTLSIMGMMLIATGINALALQGIHAVDYNMDFWAFVHFPVMIALVYFGLNCFKEPFRLWTRSLLWGLFLSMASSCLHLSLLQWFNENYPKNSETFVATLTEATPLKQIWISSSPTVHRFANAEGEFVIYSKHLPFGSHSNPSTGQSYRITLYTGWQGDQFFSPGFFSSSKSPYLIYLNHSFKNQTANVFHWN
jgi:hypothetical protein